MMCKKKKLPFVVLMIVIFKVSITRGFGQTKAVLPNDTRTEEVLLAQGLHKQKTVISGYGSAFYQRDNNWKKSKATLERIVLFVGHQFSPKISFFSELEVENAVIEGGEAGGEVAIEQAILKFNLNPNQYIVAGLFIPRVGYINENHLPTNFNGVERPIVDQIILPTTWRELGVALYGRVEKIPLNYSLGLMNGLNSAKFSHGSGIRGGRGAGREVAANNIAITAALQYDFPNFRWQISGYAGGTVGLSRLSADSLSLSSGPLGSPIYLAETNVQYAKKAFSAKALFAYIGYPDAGNINAAYAKNMASGMYGAYVEAGYDWLYTSKKSQSAFITFARVEMLDLNAALPAPPNAIYDGTLKQQHLIMGCNYMPLPNITIKADVRLLHTGKENPALVINPPPNALPYRQSNNFINVGIGYSF